jgi:hypothetical protein
MSQQLTYELMSLADLNIAFFPYGALCRSMFDSDPRSLYMALYRCIEATYAYESCRKLVDALALSMEWHRLAAALESEVGWHPQQAASLNVVLKYALEEDLAEVCRCVGAEVGPDLHVSAGRAIYQFRNRIVHFRPGSDDGSDDDMDWSALCRALVGVVVHVFSNAFVTGP